MCNRSIMPSTQQDLQQMFWEQAADVFGYDIIGSETHPMKKAFETFCEMIKDQETDDDDNDADDEEDERYNSFEAFEEWFNDEVYAYDDAEKEGKDWDEVMQEWCSKNNHEIREDGVYNMNIKKD